jgi:hypothetical protein
MEVEARSPERDAHREHAQGQRWLEGTCKGASERLVKERWKGLFWTAPPK